MYPDYSPQKIEAKWRQAWEEAGLYRAAETGDKPKIYCLEFSSYPSGDGLLSGTFGIISTNKIYDITGKILSVVTRRALEESLTLLNSQDCR